MLIVVNLHPFPGARSQHVNIIPQKPKLTAREGRIILVESVKGSRARADALRPVPIRACKWQLLALRKIKSAFQAIAEAETTESYKLALVVTLTIFFATVIDKRDPQSSPERQRNELEKRGHTLREGSVYLEHCGYERTALQHSEIADVEKENNT